MSSQFLLLDASSLMSNLRYSSSTSPFYGTMYVNLVPTDGVVPETGEVTDLIASVDQHDMEVFAKAIFNQVMEDIINAISVSTIDPSDYELILITDPDIEA